MAGARGGPCRARARARIGCGALAHERTIRCQIAGSAARLAAAGGAEPPGTACGGDCPGDGRELFAGFHPPPAVSLGKLFGARYHQPQLLSAVPTLRSGGLPPGARAHAREAHEPFGAILAGSGTTLCRLARARSRARAGLASRAAMGLLRSKLGTRWLTTKSISRMKACTGTWALPSPMANISS